MTSDKLHCKTCQQFERLHLHKSIDPEESELSAGRCKLLNSVLAMTNSNLWAKGFLYVQESFGCVLHKVE